MCHGRSCVPCERLAKVLRLFVAEHARPFRKAPLCDCLPVSKKCPEAPWTIWKTDREGCGRSVSKETPRHHGRSGRQREKLAAHCDIHTSSWAGSPRLTHPTLRLVAVERHSTAVTPTRISSASALPPGGEGEGAPCVQSSTRPSDSVHGGRASEGHRMSRTAGQAHSWSGALEPATRRHQKTHWS